MDDSAPETAEAIDLGLSVRWASVNIGAAAPEEYGDLVGWGDPTGRNRSTDNDQYPSANPPDEISGTDLDVAHVRWGGAWRLPTAAEQQELIDSTDWRRVNRNGVIGYEFTGSTGNTIFLPAVGGRIGDQLFYQVDGADYWSGTRGDDPDTARYLFYYEPFNETPRMGELPRHYGFAVRPVTD